MIVVLGQRCSEVANHFARVGKEKVVGYLPKPARDEQFHPAVVVTRSPDETVNAVVRLTELGDELKICRSAKTPMGDVEFNTLANGLHMVHKLRIQHHKTLERFWKIWHVNAIRNLPKMASCNYAGDLRIDGAPAIIVGPGPSLEKNIKVLWRAKGKAVIIALQRAARRLCQEGIIPDAIVAVDASPMVMEHLDGLPWDKIHLLVLEQSVDPSLFNVPAKKILWYVEHGDCVSFTQSILGWEKSFPGGGTVAASAVSTALAWGCDRVALVGIDLAYEDGKRYAGDVGPRAGSQIRLRSWHGSGTVESTIDLVSTHTWMQTIAKKYNMVRFFNCTEGGAWIDGMKHVRLMKFLRQLSRPIDLQSAIYAMPETGSLRKAQSG